MCSRTEFAVMTWVFSWKINLYPNSEPYFVMAMNINERIKMPIKLLCGALVLLAFSDLAACGEREIERDTCPRQAQQFARIQDQGQRKDARAQTALASCYELGMHVKPSRQQAIHWLKLAAEQGYAPAQYELGRIYLFGRGAPPDYSQALLWTGKAAQQGRADAQRNLAFIFERGLGIPADPAKAADWNRKAAQQGNAPAQLSLAQALEKGLGVMKKIGRISSKMGICVCMARKDWFRVVAWPKANANGCFFMRNLCYGNPEHRFFSPVLRNHP